MSDDTCIDLNVGKVLTDRAPELAAVPVSRPCSLHEQSCLRTQSTSRGWFQKLVNGGGLLMRTFYR